VVITIFNDNQERLKILQSIGATSSEQVELLTYNQNLFDHNRNQVISFPLPDEPHMVFWEKYHEEAKTRGVWPVLQEKLVQLQFPIQPGISHTESYQSAIRRGLPPSNATSEKGFCLQQPEALQLIIYPTSAGKIPLLYTGNRPDFIRLVQALAMRNEPASIPDSMGAQIVSGYNNWDRIFEYRQKWQQTNPVADWDIEFKRIIPQKELYQDTFIILSNNEYSGVPAPDLGLDEISWRKMSLVVRREHECTHYLTRRLFGTMRNNMLDELIADYAGIVATCGHYRADYFLRFLGLTDYPHSNIKGRIENYRGDPPLSNGALEVLKQLVIAAAHNIERFEVTTKLATQTDKVRLQMIIALTYLTLEELASESYDALLQQALKEYYF
jgi:hypothetical protein